MDFIMTSISPVQGYLLSDEAPFVVVVQSIEIKSALANKPFDGSFIFIKAWLAACLVVAAIFKSKAELVLVMVTPLKITPSGIIPPILTNSFEKSSCLLRIWVTVLKLFDKLFIQLEWRPNSDWIYGLG